MRPTTIRPQARRIGTTPAAVATAVAAIIAAAPAANANPIAYPAALNDAFYGTPIDVSEAQPGDVLAARVVPPPLGFFGTDAVQLKFRSTDSAGQPISAVTQCSPSWSRFPTISQRP
ncbi:hypothetical protein [Prescottella equi]